MELLKVRQDDWLALAQKTIAAGEHRIGYLTIERPVAIIYRAGQVEDAVCKELGYEVYEAFNNGGTIVASAGDLAVAHMAEIENGWLERFVTYFVDWLKARGLNAEYANNDVLVDGCKVCGTCITRYGRIDYSGFVVAVNVNLDHIKAICKKPMVKVPKGLSEYGITTEEVEQMFLDFCKEDECRG